MNDLIATGSTATATAAAGTAAGTAAVGFQALLGPIGLATLAIGGIVTAWTLYSNAQKEAYQEMIYTGEALQELQDELGSTTKNLQSVDALIAKWEELRQTIDIGTVSANDLSAAKDELAEVERRLVDISGGVISSYDIENGLMGEQIPLLKEILETERELAILKLQQKADATNIEELEKESAALELTKEKLKEKYDEQRRAYTQLAALEKEFEVAAAKGSDALAEFAESTFDLRQELEIVLKQWEDAQKERDTSSKNHISTEKFYNRLPYEDEVIEYDRMIASTKEAYSQIEELTFATEEDKLRLRKEYLQKIQELEKQQYTASKSLLTEEQSDRSRITDKNIQAIQDEISAYDDLYDTLLG